MNSLHRGLANQVAGCFSFLSNFVVLTMDMRNHCLPYTDDQIWLDVTFTAANNASVIFFRMVCAVFSNSRMVDIGSGANRRTAQARFTQDVV